MIRKPAVSGAFYPASAAALREMLARQIPAGHDLLEARAFIVPHAGYVYSGATAGITYSRIKLRRRFLALCPNHTGLGDPIAIMSRGSWQTPLGQVEIDESLARDLLAESELASESFPAHQYEHALEVHLPFLQFLLGDSFRFVPIVIGISNLAGLLDLGSCLARIASRSEEPVQILASSDMNHFEPAPTTRRKDQLAIERILDLDCEGLYRTIHREGISMCGYGPAVAAIKAAVLLGARKAELVSYSHSGEVTGDDSSVVGYAGLVIY